MLQYQHEKLGPGYENAWIMAGGVKTHYSWAGTTGPAVILLHGGGPGASGEAGFRYMLPALAKAGFRAYAVDQLSMGYTEARPHAWPVLGHQSLVNHVRDFIETLCLDEVYLAGNSQGSYISAKLAIDHPEKVKKCVFIGSASIALSMGMTYPDKSKNPVAKAWVHYDYTEEGMRNFLLANVNKPETVTDLLVKKRHEAASLPGVRESAKVMKDYQERMLKEPKLWDRYSLKYSLPNLKIPCKFIWGLEDHFAPPEMGRELSALLPNIPFEFLPGAGHQCQTDQPEVVNQIIIDFFKK